MVIRNEGSLINKQNKNVKWLSFSISVSFATLPYNKGCTNSYDIMSVWKIMSSASLFFIKANNSSLARMRSKWLPSLPASQTRDSCSRWSPYWSYWGVKIQDEYWWIKLILMGFSRSWFWWSGKTITTLRFQNCLMFLAVNKLLKLYNSLEIKPSVQLI